MANLKNITELPVAESADGLNLIVNDNGAAKQIAASAVSKVKTVNGAQPDESGNVQIDTASSWNDLKDKPFYAEIEKIAIFKNQNTVSDDYTVIEIDPSHLAKLKVGDFIEIVYNDVSYLTVLNHPMEDGSSAIYEIGNPFLIGAAEQYDTGEPFYAVIVPEAIFPIFCAENAIVSAYLNVETVHKLDAKYLPNSGGYSFAFKNARYKSSNTYYFVDKGLYDAIKRGEAPPGVFTEFDEESSNMLNLFTPRYYLVDEFIGGISVSLMLGSEESSRQVFICDTDEHAFDHYDR